MDFTLVNTLAQCTQMLYTSTLRPENPLRKNYKPPQNLGNQLQSQSEASALGHHRHRWLHFQNRSAANVIQGIGFFDVRAAMPKSGNALLICTVKSNAKAGRGVMYKRTELK
jgi:hypothetical protein